jgi:hypothetical protein
MPSDWDLTGNKLWKLCSGKSVYLEVNDNTSLSGKHTIKSQIKYFEETF